MTRNEFAALREAGHRPSPSAARTPRTPATAGGMRGRRRMQGVVAAHVRKNEPSEFMAPQSEPATIGVGVQTLQGSAQGKSTQCSDVPLSTYSRSGNEGHPHAPTLRRDGESHTHTHTLESDKGHTHTHSYTRTKTDRPAGRRSRVDQPTGWAPSGTHAAGSLAASERCLRPTTPSAMCTGVSVDRRHALIAARWCERYPRGWNLLYLVSSRPRFLSEARLAR